MVIKWFWYASAALAAAALLLALFALGRLAPLGPDADAVLDEASAATAVEDDGGEQSSDAPLVTAARRFAERWQPKPPPQAPTFLVTETVLHEDPKQQRVFIRPDAEAEPTEHKLKDVVAGYQIDAIKITSIDVSLRGKTFTVAVVKPAAPDFVVVRTELPQEVEAPEDEPAEEADTEATLDAARARAYLRPNEAEEGSEEVYEVGAVIDAFRLEAIKVTSAIFRKRGYAYELNVPKPPVPPFALVKAMPDADPQPSALVQLAEDAEPQNVTLGDDIVGYALKAVSARSIKVTQLGYEFEVTQPKPPAPSFVLARTQTVEGDEKAGLIWVILTEGKTEQEFTVGDTVEQYTLRAVAQTFAVFDREGFEYTVEVPRPADPSWQVAKVVVGDDQPQRAYIKLTEEVEAQAYTLADDVAGYVIVSIDTKIVRVNRLGYLYDVSVPPAPPAPPAPNFKVTATMVVGTGGVAYVGTPTQNKAQTLMPGDELDGYTLTRVKDGVIEVAKDGYVFELKVAVPEAQSIEADPNQNAADASSGSALRRNRDGSVTLIGSAPGVAGGPALPPPAPAPPKPNGRRPVRGSRPPHRSPTTGKR